MKKSIADAAGSIAADRSGQMRAIPDNCPWTPGFRERLGTPGHGERRGQSAALPWIDYAALATVILLVIAVVAGNSGRNPGDRQDAGSRGGAPVSLSSTTPATSPEPTTPATPTTLAAGPFIDIAECDTEARPPGSLEMALESDPTIPGVFPPLHSDQGAENAEVDLNSVLDGLPTAEPAAVDAIGGTLRQLIACRFYSFDRFAFGPDGPLVEGRYFALFSDDFFRREFRASAGAREPGRFHTWWQPLSSLPLDLDDARSLPDGRIVGKMRSQAANPRVEHVLVFVETTGRWLVDEVVFHFVGDRATPEAEARPTVAWDHVLEIAVADDQNVTHVYPDTFHANTEILVTVANLGTGVQRFEVPALGIVAEVPPGQSVDLVFRADEGDYRLRAALLALPESNATPDPTIRVGPRLDAEIHVIPQGQVIPRG